MDNVFNRTGLRNKIQTKTPSEESRWALYEKYKAECKIKGIQHVYKQKFFEIINKGNRKIRDYAISEKTGFKLDNVLGLMIVERSKLTNLYKLRKMEKHGEDVRVKLYNTDGNHCKLRWKKAHTFKRFANKNLYMFAPYRTAIDVVKKLAFTNQYLTGKEISVFLKDVIAPLNKPHYMTETLGENIALKERRLEDRRNKKL